MSDEIVSFENVSKRYHKRDSLWNARDSFWAIRNVSFGVLRGETVGVVGSNGAGKTTLMRLIAGISAPTTGHVEVHGRVAPLLSMEGCLQNSLSGRENIGLLLSLHGTGRRRQRAILPHIVDFSGLEDFLEMPVRKYSMGMRTRLSFAVSAHVNAQILLVDETLSVGDAEFQEKLRAMIVRFQKDGGTLFFASHSAAEILAICDRALWLDKGTLAAEGPAADVLSRYQSHGGSPRKA